MNPVAHRCISLAYLCCGSVWKGATLDECQSTSVNFVLMATAVDYCFGAVIRGSSPLYHYSRTYTTKFINKRNRQKWSYKAVFYFGLYFAHSSFSNGPKRKNCCK